MFIRSTALEHALLSHLFTVIQNAQLTSEMKIAEMKNAFEQNQRARLDATTGRYVDVGHETELKIYALKKQLVESEYQSKKQLLESQRELITRNMPFIQSTQGVAADILMAKSGDFLSFLRADEVMLDRQNETLKTLNEWIYSLKVSHDALLRLTNGLIANIRINVFGFGLTHIAAEAGDVGVLRWLIEEQGADINLHNNDGYTALMCAAGNASTEATAYLIDHSANVNFATTRAESDSTTGAIPKGTTALHVAVRFGKVENCELLISNIATKMMADEDGHTPLAYCRMYLDILSDLTKNKLLADIHFGPDIHRNVSKIPSVEHLKIIMQMLQPLEEEKYQEVRYNFSSGQFEQKTDAALASSPAATHADDTISQIESLRSEAKQLCEREILKYHSSITGILNSLGIEKLEQIVATADEEKYPIAKSIRIHKSGKVFNINASRLDKCLHLFQSQEQKTLVNRFIDIASIIQRLELRADNNISRLGGDLDWLLRASRLPVADKQTTFSQTSKEASLRGKLTSIIDKLNQASEALAKKQNQKTRHSSPPANNPDNAAAPLLSPRLTLT